MTGISLIGRANYCISDSAVNNMRGMLGDQGFPKKSILCLAYCVNNASHSMVQNPVKIQTRQNTNFL